MGRRNAAVVLVLVGGVLLAVGLPLRHLHGVTRPDAFSGHAAALLDRPVVREALADAAADAVADEVRAVRPEAVPAARALVTPRAARIVASPAFRTAWRATARRGLRRVLDDRRRRVAFTLADVAAVTEEATGPLPPPLAPLLQSLGPVPVVEFERGRTAAVRTARVERLSGLGRPALAASTLALLLALVLSPARPRTALGCGAGVALASGAVLAAELGGRVVTIGAAGAGRDRDVAAAVWDELLGGLRTDALLLAAAGAVVAALAVLAGRAEARRRPGHRV